MPTPLVSGTTYYVIVSAAKIKLAASAVDAGTGTAIDITAKGTGTLRISPVGDGFVDIWDTIDDYNNNLGTAPNALPPGWAASYICDDTNFTDVSDSAVNLTPPDTTPPGATSTFSEIWRDDLTGLYFTNILYDGSGAVTWAGGMSMCAGIDSGDGAGLWRMPTQKELMQLYVDGIANRPVAGGTWANQYMWSSSGVSVNTSSAWDVHLADGYSTTDGRTNTFIGVFCVR